MRYVRVKIKMSNNKVLISDFTTDMTLKDGAVIHGYSFRLITIEEDGEEKTAKEFYIDYPVGFQLNQANIRARIIIEAIP